MRACVLVGVAPEEEQAVAETLGRLNGVVDAFPVLGQPEVVLRLEIDGMGELGRVLGDVSETDGVLVSETLIEIPAEAIE